MTRPADVFKSLFVIVTCSVTSPLWAQSGIPPAAVAGAAVDTDTDMAADTAADQEQDRLDGLFAELQQPDLPNWEAVEAQIWDAWSRSGSPAMDLLLQRGREALESEDLGAAIEHLTALTDYAPDFAEGWNARATAFFQADELGLSLADIERTLALNPRHFGALGGLAAILEMLDQPRAALSAYRAAHTIHPHRPNVEDAIERLERELGDAEL